VRILHHQDLKSRCNGHANVSFGAMSEEMLSSSKGQQSPQLGHSPPQGIYLVSDRTPVGNLGHNSGHPLDQTMIPEFSLSVAQQSYAYDSGQ
jgi:hypothetical protein